VVSIGSEVYKSPYAYAAVAARKFPVHVTIAGKDYIGLVEIRGEAYWHLDCSKKMLANYPLIPAPPPEQIPEAPCNEHHLPSGSHELHRVCSSK
ncbi:MAG TPA: hypothetical protein VEX38_09390, partial [Fimbriimonadaceae bacterium]|nr:hypothetical protein [Fimbriimonadaceae bacterium]